MFNVFGTYKVLKSDDKSLLAECSNRLKMRVHFASLDEKIMLMQPFVMHSNADG